jgi:hypothetical protein
MFINMALREVNKEWDSCLSRFVEYSFKGAVVGVVVGGLFFRKRVWTAAYFSGIGAGASYFECEQRFRKIYGSPN